ncbi:TATA-binding protein-associated factor 172-like [Oppia nitens]|uniref:TATA-binding protein-associated factor 172-like n=1 Tax=Oppia nitens TaxID=1686743 RepID=UPI0023D9B0FF|nr:TATA-binding protein-associated factor 172-like [Oppia nitens]
MSSRLDRLLLLLETGSTAVTRKAAALQLGEVQRLHPHELHNLLNKVRPYLRSNSWETRIAASQAVEAIVANVPVWMPAGSRLTSSSGSEIDCQMTDASSSSQSTTTTTTTGSTGRMSFEKYDINTVIKCGHNLLASEGKEFDDIGDNNSATTANSAVDLKEKIALQRQALNHKLGLDVANHLGLQLDFITNSDLTDDRKPNSEVNSLQQNTNKLDEILTKATGSSLKRKLKKRRQSTEQKSSIDESNGGLKKIKTETEDSDSINSNDSNTFDITQTNEWPLESFADELLSDLFSASWEVRHGAATALREIIKLQGKCGGRTNSTPSHLMDQMNQLWLEDISLRLISVLALDRFGDFVSDQVVAPVRETCAQALGLVLNLLVSDGVYNVLKILLQLLKSEQWEARHGGMLGLKYLLAIRQDMTCHLIPIVFQPIFNGLKDSVDDVSAVAAAALVPIKEDLMKTLPEKVPIVINYLWEALPDLDDLSSSTGDLLMLLSSLLVFNSDTNSTQNLVELVPRLWPFLNHSLSSVRKSVLESLLILCSKTSTDWLTVSLLSDSMRLLFQRCLLENNEDILKNLYEVWFKFTTKASLENVMQASCQHLSGWFCLMMHPAKIPIDASTSQTWLQLRGQSLSSHQSPDDNQSYSYKSRHNKPYDNHNGREQYFIGGTELLADNPEDRERFVIRARHQAAKFIGLLAYFVTKPLYDTQPSAMDSFANILLFHLSSKSAMQRMCIAWVIKEWAKAFNNVLDVTIDDNNDNTKNNCWPQSVTDKCLDCLQEIVYFDEISSHFTRLQLESRDFVNLVKKNKFTINEEIYKPGAVYTFEQINSLANSVIQSPQLKSKSKQTEVIEERCRGLLKTTSQISKYQTSLSTCVLSSLAGSLISWKQLPSKLNPVVRPLMDSLKIEENEQLQCESAHSLVGLLSLCCDRSTQTTTNDSTVSPVPKIIKNLITYLCCDRNFTPEVKPLDSTTTTQKQSGIICLDNMQKFAERQSFRRSNSLNANKKSKSIDTSATTTSIDETGGSSPISCDQQLNDKQNEVLRRGASLALSETAKHFGADIPTKLPNLWEQITQIVDYSEKSKNDGLSLDEAKSLLQCLQVLEIIGPHLHQELHSYLKSLLNSLCLCLESPLIAIRHLASRCFGMFSHVIKADTMDVVLSTILELLELSESDTNRQGALEAIHCVTDSLGFSIVPYIVLLIVPMLGRMSDHNDSVRLLATHCFAQLVQLMPLDNDNNNKSSANNTNNTVIKKELMEKKQKERRFLEQLMNIKKLDDYKLPVPVKAELRQYQQDGVNWLGFLNKYKLHGIVADEMGLGKTLQAICILASDHHYLSIKVENSSIECKQMASIVICPPTLTGHWLYEIDKFVSTQYLRPLHYTGPPNERTKLRKKIKRNDNKVVYNIVIASYDIVRNDIEFFSTIHWNYCVLDEGHVIKNGKTKLSKAIKSLFANHRLILTGTPIQNNVLELWSLFDFLMPGFLGTERQFMARYSRPILQSRDAKSSSKEQEAGVLAMESLHRQVLPFILRRMKEDVLKDLPPKIMQDYYCELSSLQSKLYEDFAKSKARQSLQDSVATDNTTTDKSNTSATDKTNIASAHIFQALQYLRKVCNHPKLVLSPTHPQYETITSQLKQEKSSLSDITHAAKLCALRQLLLDCGIGTQQSNQINATEPVVNQHRALVFCQLKSMLDIVENDLLRAHMPSVTYLRLDGNIPPIQRHSVVHRFNNDPSIDILLLTTQVGGLGLNLTGADTVIFVEHDWNPMKDLQAMDRAHRIGQKKVVNVYRLITTGTLEEKIMGLQKFKLTIANTVISSDNSNLQTMATDQLLDLFSFGHNSRSGDTANKGITGGGGSGSGGSGMKNVLENLPELWDSQQYDNEYDLTQFIQSLKS